MLVIQGSALLMTMSDIAALARVQRPVVSVWRRRTAGSDRPFPDPVSGRGGQLLFDAHQIGEWLADTGHGNNPEALTDVAAHATLGGRTPHPSAPHTTPDRKALTGLLALRHVLGHSLASLSDDELLDAADEQDPDDDVFFREINGAGVQRHTLAAYIDELVEAAYNDVDAFEYLTGRTQGDPDALSPAAVNVIAQTALALAAGQPGDPVFVDASGGSGEISVAIAHRPGAGERATLLTPDDDSAEARLLRRRLLVHDIPRQAIRLRDGGAFEVTGPVVHLGVFPTGPAAGAAGILSAIDQVVLQMDDAQLGVMLAPTSILSDAGLDRGPDELRSTILRSGRVRAIIRLPAGLRVHKPQQSQTLWVLGAAHENIDLADRWTMVADLSAQHLDATVITDLVSDLVASLGDQKTVRAHSFRFARLAFTRTLLATRDALVAGATTRHTTAASPNSGGADIAVRVDALLDALQTPPQQPDLGRLTAATPREPAPILTVEQRIAAGQLKYIPGNRLDETSLMDGGNGENEASGFAVLGTAEILGERAIGSRTIDRLRFATDYPAGRVSEPGDVVFCTTPRPAAIIDWQGTSVVAFPARILRIRPHGTERLLPDMLTADILALPPRHKHWRSWPLREVDPIERAALVGALASIRWQQDDATRRLTQLQELTSILTTGISAGTLTFTDISASPKGTR